MRVDKHVCPFGLKSKSLRESEGYTVEDHWLTTREEAFKRRIASTPPQTACVGGLRPPRGPLRRVLLLLSGAWFWVGDAHMMS